MRIGIDVGGTFTDFVLLDDATGRLDTYKCLTTARDPSDAIAAGVTALAARHPGCTARLEEVVHGTTLVINAILERKGARTGLVTTRGFRDVLELGREIRYAAYDVFAQFPEPLVPRERRLEVSERLRADGSVLEALDEAQARSVLRALTSLEVESIAVCLLNSFENPVHELALKRLVAEELPGVSVSISYEVLPQIREYERTSTTVTNAYVKPLTEGYLRRLRARLGTLGFQGRLFIMLSSGGVTSAETAAEHPVRIIESGPTAAVIAGQYFSRLFEVPQMFCFDMGGTTAKSCLIQGGTAGVVPTFEVGRVQRFQKGSGLTIQVPVVDLMEIGAGGGSIARPSRMGTLQVGPESAAADPGPICYGRGGVEPTVTDADLLLGYLDPDYFLGGAMKLDAAAARRGIEERVAEPLGVPYLQAVWGIHDLINETMAAAAKTHIAERGGNPRALTVAAFGGAGPVHACGLARKLGAPRVIVPPNAGVGSAMGFFAAPRAFDLVRSHKTPLLAADFARLEALFRELEAECERTLRRSGATGAIEFARSVDARFIGQGSETTLALPERDFARLDRAALRARFDDEYRRLYGRTYPESPVEFVSFRVRASLPVRLLALPKLPPPAGARVDQALKGERRAYSPRAGDFVPHRVYDRYRLYPGAALAGPAIIEERESTIVVGEDACATVDEYGFVWMDVAQEAAHDQPL
ncbi:MAG: hydantoinase/oxoprolinase family protein [Betaproteobacteria bacterium]|nr:hydantoinase/oxoprolinase family protein [Betaproteobacteria bacterium]